ncbi:MAG: hypothetical protein ACYDAL_05995 [Candidatus Dormibacteraceae bacterium]
MRAARDRGATRALILGLLSLPFGVCAPFAIWSAGRSLRRLRRSRGELTGEANALVGLGAGIVGAAFLVLGIAYWWLAS